MSTRTKTKKSPPTIVTGLPRTPNEGAYAPEAIAPSKDQTRSRFGPLRRTTEGHKTASAAAAIAGAYRALAFARIASTPPAHDEKAVKLWYVARDQNGDVRRVPRGTYKGTVELQLGRSGRFQAPASEAGGALIDRYLVERDFDPREEEVWAALETLVAEELAGDAAATREVNDAVCAALLCRAGLRLPTVHDLPAIGQEHR